MANDCASSLETSPIRVQIASWEREVSNLEDELLRAKDRLYQLQLEVEKESNHD